MLSVAIRYAAAPRKLAEIGAPKIVACAAWSTSGCVIGPIGLSSATPKRSTWKRAKKIGICRRIGRHDEKGFVPFSRYSFIISSDCFWRSSLYRFWSALISGCKICSARCALICLTKSGINRIRMTTTSPTIDSAQAAPLAGGMKMLQKECQVTRTQATIQ